MKGQRCVLDASGITPYRCFLGAGGTGRPVRRRCPLLFPNYTMLGAFKPSPATHCSRTSPTPQSIHRLENAVGWYHSHPGYGCWLSGIDCTTQVWILGPSRSRSIPKVDLKI